MLHQSLRHGCAGWDRQGEGGSIHEDNRAANKKKSPKETSP